MTKEYLEQMRAHVDEGGQLSHRNGVDLLAEIERLTATAVPTKPIARDAGVALCK